ncbi:MAG: hypothetical protein WC079_02770 [Bacteroidales bacterium]
MKNLIFALCFAVLITFAGCNKENPDQKEFNFEFQTDAEGWTGDFADYPDSPGVEEFYEFAFSHSMLPAPLDATKGALMQSGNNHSDDLFMFIKKKLTGLEPDKLYSVNVEIEIASNAASGMAGVGGAPGESVVIKAGASKKEPAKELVGTDYRMNIDKGSQNNEGGDMVIIGDFANGTQENVYTLKTLKTTNPVNVSSDSNGEIWIIIGTDSGFEATTTIYYNTIKVKLN